MANVRKNPRLSGTTYTVYGIQVGVGATVLIRKRDADGASPACCGHYRAQDEYARAPDKLAGIAPFGSIAEPFGHQLPPSVQNDDIAYARRALAGLNRFRSVSSDGSHAIGQTLVPLRHARGIDGLEVVVVAGDCQGYLHRVVERVPVAGAVLHARAPAVRQTRHRTRAPQTGALSVNPCPCGHPAPKRRRGIVSTSARDPVSLSRFRGIERALKDSQRARREEWPATKDKLAYTA
jgi:hypothetical protein